MRMIGPRQTALASSKARPGTLPRAPAARGCALPHAACQPPRQISSLSIQPHCRRLARLPSGNGTTNGKGTNGNAEEVAFDTDGQPLRYGSENKYQKLAEDALLSAWDAEGMPKHHTSRRGVTNKVQLSTYADCIGNNVQDLATFLQTEIRDAIGSVHLLPLYPSTGDRGFAPVNYLEVSPEFGSWWDVEILSLNYQVCLEYMVNHISPASPQFQDYLKNGEKSIYANMFVKWNDIWPEGGPTRDQLALVRTRKPAPPVIRAELADGSVVPLWCTFSEQQIDINPFDEKGWEFTEQSLRSICENGRAKLIRLDAFGYVTKKAGTTCFMGEPDTWDLLEKIKEVVRPYGVQLLCEVHEDFLLNVELARHGFWVYDFALPLLMLHALKFQTAEALKHWLSICPRRQITTLDTHDGMGVDDITGLAPLVDIPELEKSILDIGGNINYKHFYIPHEDGTEEGSSMENGHAVQKHTDTLREMKEFLQPDCQNGYYKSEQHQYNATYFSAVGEDPKKYLLARAIQFFTPGVPMVYYVGLLGGVNDYELCAKGGIRDINRHYYSLEEASEAVKTPMVQALLELCRFRNTHPAFKGRIFVDDTTAPYELHVRWYFGSGHVAVLEANMETYEFVITHTPYDHHDSAQSSPYSVDMASVFSIDAMDLQKRASTRKIKSEAANMPKSRPVAAPSLLSTEDSFSSAASSMSVGPYEDPADDAALEWFELDLSYGWGGKKAVVPEPVRR